MNDIKNKSKLSKKIKRPIIAGSAVGIIFVIAFIAVTLLTDLPVLYTGIAVIVAFVYTMVLSVNATVNRLKDQRKSDFDSISLDSDLSRIFRDGIALPCIICEHDGTIIVANAAMTDMIGHELAIGEEIQDFCSSTFDDIIDASLAQAQLMQTSDAASKLPDIGLGKVTQIGQGYYVAKSSRTNVSGRECYLISFEDVTVLKKVYGDMLDDRTAVAFVILDDLDELMQYVKNGYRSAANEIEVILKDWANELGGVIYEYDRDKYVLLIPKKKLNECIENKFAILDRIRNIRVGEDNISVTVSIGISAGDGSLLQRDKEATSALELALSRGGDQVAIRNGSKIEYFGGRNKVLQRQSKVRPRINAELLCARITESSNVIIMGHKNPDFDSIGSCVGVARLCMFCGVKVNIVIDTENENYRLVSKRLSKYPEYSEVFMNASDCRDAIRPNTLVIVCDTNNMSIAESPEIVDSVERLAVIDHHRQTAKFVNEPLLCYIDSAASSASELVCELIEQAMGDNGLLSEEANAMLSGIMLDTKQFTKEASARTFMAALYLQKAGAGVESSRALFYEDIDDFKALREYYNNMTVYKDRIAVTCSRGTGDSESDRASASKAADKLLEIKQIDAVFALVPEDDKRIRISARSSQSVNVQLILEKLGGGGHFGAAGAIVNGGMEATVEALKKAIDDYLGQN